MSYILFMINLGRLDMKKYIVTLTEDERDALGILVSKGNHKSQTILNALILLGGLTYANSTRSRASLVPLLRPMGPTHRTVRLKHYAGRLQEETR